MSWNEFIYFAIGSLVLWTLGTVAIYRFKRSLYGELLIVGGLVLFSLFIALLWNYVNHPPLRTMGETRLWYSLFLVLVGYVTYKRWHYKWLMAYSVLVSAVFIFVNLLKPEIHGTNLMPALQSLWFVPHVTVYILSYAMMGAATIASIITLSSGSRREKELLPLIDNLVYIGFAFLVLGMLMGAVWAKEAWGDYWTWDPKEVWAFITASAYLVYMHAHYAKITRRDALWIIPIAFVLLMITWLGVNYLPAAQGSIHTY